ncbi:class I SAM-dependent methyltransferase [Modestobacter versicolor]|uniref:class I SAM-dependent methyltransferase n=1 Tax=Modestobacter versicolor TaxID=429133 RepID=UPI0034DE22DF
MSDEHVRQATVFGSFAEEYDRWRPGYPDEAVDWLLPPGARDVLDLGAGTGKLTASLLARDLRVTVVEPDPAMLAVLTRAHPSVVVHRAGADALPLPDRSVDAVVVGQAWHWFPHEAAVAEVRRVLRPGGWLGVVWNLPDDREPWERDLAELDPERDVRSRALVPTSGPPEVEGLPAGEVQRTSVHWTWELAPDDVRAMLATDSRIAVLPERERDELLDASAAVVTAEAHRRGAETVPLHRVSVCFRWRPGGW